jgi:beta-alanine degradation protein BauB
MAEELGPIGTKVLFEDEDVRVWKLDLAAGQATPVHQHEHDYVFVVVAGGPTEVVNRDGTSEHSTDHRGDAVHHQAPLVHQLRNLGDSRYVNVIVEFLRTGAGAAGPRAGQSGNWRAKFSTRLFCQ